MPINGITKEMAFGFYDYLQQAIPANQKSGITDVSASSIVIKIKAIFERAYDTEIIKKNPFKGLKLQNKSQKKEELNISEFKRFYDLYLLADRKLEVYKDIFLFSVFTGLPYGDIYCLTWNQIRLENQEYILQKNSAKTKVEIKQVLVKQTVVLIEKYKNDIETEITGRLFPKRHLNNVNDYLKVLQKMAFINNNISTHIARHTCSQFLRDLGQIQAFLIR